MEKTRTDSREAEVRAWIEGVEQLLTGQGQETSLIAGKANERAAGNGDSPSQGGGNS